jgi:hypothetical protein
VQYGIITPTNSSLPKINLRSGDAINESISTVASSATPDIWTNTSNNINYTGTTTATGFAAAPQAGVTRTLILAAAASFTAGANMLIDGVVSFTGSAGDEVEVTAITTTQFRLRPKKADGTTLVVASNAEYAAGTDAIKPLTAAVARARNLVQGTVVTASGTSIDFTGLPSWVKRITVMFNGVSTNGTSLVQVQIGDSGGIENTGYLGGYSLSTGGAVSSGNHSTGFAHSWSSAANVRHGKYTIELITGNIWACTLLIGASDTTGVSYGGGTKTLSDTLDRIRITTIGGVDTFDAGSFNIIYE